MKAFLIINYTIHDSSVATKYMKSSFEREVTLSPDIESDLTKISFIVQTAGGKIEFEKFGYDSWGNMIGSNNLDKAIIEVHDSAYRELSYEFDLLSRATLPKTVNGKHKQVLLDSAYLIWKLADQTYSHLIVHNHDLPVDKLTIEDITNR